MKKFIFIGSIGIHKYNSIGGEIMKNRELLKYFREEGLDPVVIDIEKYKERNPLKTFTMIAKLLLTFLWPFPRTVVISKYPLGAEKILKLAKFTNVFRKNILYLVIGGDFVTLIQTKTVDTDYFKNLRLIIVERMQMQVALQEMGFKNVIYKPNFKHVREIKSNYSKPGEVMKLVYLSRIMPEKGVELILNALDEINRDRLLFQIDFYGPIQPAYDSNRFAEIISKCDFASYRGILDMEDSKSYEILSSYDLFVFPTYFDGEGFPGVLIDAMIAGVPILASDFRFNSEIVNENVGYLFRSCDKEDLIDKLIMIYNNKEELLEKRRAIRNEKYKYDVNVVCEQILEEIRNA